MASAFPEFDAISEQSETSESCVEPKVKLNTQSEEIRKKAYVPKTLPKDFLRVMLNEQQVNDQSDEELARRLQFGVRVNRPQQMHAVNYRGRLQIDIIEAQLNKNYGLIKMDPYVRMTINGKVYETPTDYSGAKNPVWNKTIMCYVPIGVDMIKFEIFDEKSFTDDDLIAVVKFPLSESLFTSGFIDERLPLSGKLGEQKEGSINIRILFTSIDQLQRIEQANNTRHNLNTIPGLHAHPPQAQRSPQPNVQLPPDMDSELNRALQLSARESASKSAYSEEDLKNLNEMFPSFDQEVIKSLLEANKGNKEATIESILQMS